MKRRMDYSAALTPRELPRKTWPCPRLVTRMLPALYLQRRLLPRARP